MFKLLSLAVALAAPMAASAQIVTSCDTYVFTFNSDIYQCGQSLTQANFTAPDACDHGTPGFRPIAPADCARLIALVQNANYSSTSRFSSTRCRDGGTQGDTLSNWGCYNSTSNVNRIMSATATSQTICNKTRSYFTMDDPLLNENHKCGCGTGSPGSKNCTGVAPGFECMPGMRCTDVDPTRSLCTRDPMADHGCCHSLNHIGPDVRPGTCCLGARADNGWIASERRCVPGREFKNVTITGIPNCTLGLAAGRKTEVMEGGLCTQTKPTSSSPDQQGECMLGLRCSGLNGYGFCTWWDRPDFRNATRNMNVYEGGCEPNDCRVGAYCFRTWAPNGEVQYSQCRPLMPGMNATAERSDGLITNPLANRIYKAKLGKCIGVVGTSWGDPHIITYDNLRFDCMAAGDFVLSENCLFKLHSRFDVVESRIDVSQGKAMALQTGHATPNNTADDSLLQMYFPEPWLLNKTNVSGAHAVYQDDCPVRILFNGVELPRPPTGTNGKLLGGRQWHNSSLLNITTSTEGGMFYHIVDYANGGTARFRVAKWQHGCFFSVDLCIPQQTDFSCYRESTGLLGIPDANRANDWMMKTNTSIMQIPVDTSSQRTIFNYCSKNWCITDGSSILPVSNDGVNGTYSRSWYQEECRRPFPGDVNYTFCYAIERCDQFLVGRNVTKGVTLQSALPTEYRACCIACMGGTNSPACIGEEQTIKDIKENSVVTPDGLVDLLVPPAVTCSNLGTGLSGPTNFKTPVDPNPANPSCGATACKDNDDSWSVFVGGDLTVKRGNAIEGRTYVGGSFVTLATEAADDSLRYMGWVPCGAQICPNTMQTVLETCGNVNLQFGVGEKIDMMLMDGMSGYVRYGGSFMENGRSLNATVVGSETIVNSTRLISKGIISRATADQRSAICFKKDQTLTPLTTKASYWASSAFKNNAVFLTGNVTVDAINKEIVLNGPATGNGCTIVIDLAGSILNRGTETGWKIVFGDRISSSQTVLINVSGMNVAVRGVAVMEDKIDGIPVSGYNFDNRLMVKTLWNFFQATTVSIGNPGSITSLEWQGSILAPLANVDFNIKSHLGRMVVGGSLTVDYPDATFYNYYFDPKGDKCELPKPPSDNCVPVAPSPPIPGLQPLCDMTTYIATDVGSTVCLDRGSTQSIVRLDGAIGFDGSAFASGQGIFYGIKLSPGGSTIKFNVNNPFKNNSDIYVKHESFFQGTTWLDPTCEAVYQQPNCLTSPFEDDGDRQFEVSCSAHGTTGRKYAQVYVYFATDSAEVRNFSGQKLSKVDKCCHPTPYQPQFGFVELMYKIDCECPPPGVSGAATRKLRGNL